jgi:hypothetical protein
LPTRNTLSKGWLEALVAEELARHDPEAALARLPTDVRGAGTSSTDLVPAARLLVARSLRARPLEPGADATAAFREEVRLHLALLLDLATLRGERHHPGRGRREMAAFLAAALGLPEAYDVLPTAPVPARAVDVERALAAAEDALARRFHPPGDPVLGLPLHPGAVAILRRRLARVAAGFHRAGRLDPGALVRHAEYAGRESVLLVEALAGLLSAEGAADERAASVRRRQLQNLGLWGGAARDARAALAGPRDAAELARATPEPVRGFLAEQLFLAQLRAKLPGERARRFVEAFVAATGLDEAAVAAARVEAAAQLGDHQAWFEAFDEGSRPLDWQAFAGEWGAATDAVVERVSSAVTDNFGAVVREIRETGELGQLLARAASGQTLTAAERKKVRAQLIDLAKAVPALAIFAAPGGMLLLPLLAKLLPFNLLPSAWDRAPKAEPPAKPAGAATPADAEASPGDPAKKTKAV